MTTPASPKILFVCLGNICRSPAAEGVFKHFLQQQAHAESIFVDSAGTIGFHQGKPADARMRKAAQSRNIQLTSRARQVCRGDLDRFDLVVAMDRSNLEDLKDLHPNPSAQLIMLGACLPNQQHAVLGPDVPDPYYGGEDGFEHVLNMLEEACEGLWQRLK